MIPITPVPAEGAMDMVSLYQAHQKIYPRSVQGVFAKWRWLMVVITQLVFYGLPWLEWGQRQAVLFDLGPEGSTSSASYSTHRTSFT